MKWRLKYFFLYCRSKIIRWKLEKELKFQYERAGRLAKELTDKGEGDSAHAIVLNHFKETYEKSRNNA